MVPLLRFDCFRDDLLAGLVTSVGGITKSLSKESGISLFSLSLSLLCFLHVPLWAISFTGTALVDFLLSSNKVSPTSMDQGAKTTSSTPIEAAGPEQEQQAAPQMLVAMGNSLVALFKRNLNNDRITLPLLKTLHLLLANGCFSPMQPPRYTNIIIIIIIDVLVLRPWHPYLLIYNFPFFNHPLKGMHSARTY